MAGYCEDRLPTKKIYELAGVPPLSYPDPSSWVTTGVHSTPVILLQPFLAALDDRIARGDVSPADDARALHNLLTVLRDQGAIVQANGFPVLQYTEAIEGVPAPYISSMAQSELLRIAATSYALGGYADDLTLAVELIRSFSTPWSQGGLLHLVRPGVGSFEEYANPTMREDQLLEVLNGFLHSMHNLAKTLDLGIPQINSALEPLYRLGLGWIDARIASYETGFGWTYYDSSGENRATADYHVFQTMLLHELACREHRQEWADRADSWWGDYLAKMPFVRVDGTTSSGPKEPELIHLRGIYPHPYLSDEAGLVLIGENGSSAERLLHETLENQYRSSSAPVSGSLNLLRADDVAGVSGFSVWIEKLLGFPMLYRVHRQAVPKEAAPIPTARFVACDSGEPLGSSEGYGAWDEHRSLVVYTTTSAQYEVVCATLPTDIRPSRTYLRLAGPAVGSSRVDGFVAQPDGSVEFSVPPPGTFRDYRDNESFIVYPLSGLTLPPTALIEVPVSASGVSSIRVQLYLHSGEVLTRYLPFEGPVTAGAGYVRFFLSSLPRYRQDGIDKLGISLILDPTHPPTVVRVGRPSLLCGPEALLSSFTAEPTDTGTGWKLRYDVAATGRLILALTDDTSCTAQ